MSCLPDIRLLLNEVQPFLGEWYLSLLQMYMAIIYDSLGITWDPVMNSTWSDVCTYYNKVIESLVKKHSFGDLTLKFSIQCGLVLSNS